MGRIVDYPEITTLSDGDYLIVDNAEGGTKKVSAQSVAGTVDPTPTESSTNAVSSGGVWTSLNDISEEFDGLRTDAYDVYPKGIASGDIVQFETGADNVPLSDLTGYIYPMMSGSGMPSRTNIRTISGPDDINIYQRNKNLIEQITYQSEPETVYLGVQNSSNLTMFFKAGDYRITVNIVGGPTVVPYWAIGSTATHSEYMHLDNDTNVSIYVYDADGISASDIESFQVEVGTDATDYVEFEGDITNVVLPTDRGTIYSGRVALTAGKVYIDTVIYERNSSTMNNTEDKPGWAYTGLQTYDVAIGTFDDVIYWPNGDVRCTNVNVGSTYSIEAANEDYSLILPRDVYNMSQSQWISAGVDIQILVKLNTPIEIDIDPVEVRSLYGFNTYYCNSGKTGVIFGMDLAKYISDKTTDVEDEAKKKIEKAFATDTASGAVATFTDGADDIPMKSVKVAIEPVQDLHGYDHPWPAGGGKNLFDQDTVYASYKQSDGSFIGLAANINAIRVNVPSNLVGKTLTFSASVKIPSGSTINNIRVVAVVNGENIIGNPVEASTYTTSRVVFTPTSTDDLIYVSYGSGSDQLIQFKEVQLEIGSTPTSYAPYSNICPISGWTGAQVVRAGKNLFDGKFNNLAIASMDTVKLAEDATYRGMYSRVVGGNTYTVSRKLIETNRFRICATIEEPANNIGAINLSNIPTNDSLYSITVTVPEGYNYLFVYLSNQADTCTADNYQIELGSTATAYEPYTGNTYPITFPTEAGTVYGGELDVTNGTLTVDRAGVDLGTLTWAYNTTYGFFWTTSVPKAYGLDNAICSAYAYGRWWNTWTDKDCVWCGNANNQNITIKDTRYTDGVSFKAAVSGVMLCYELATPITYHLTPTEIKSLLGDNNVWADCGDTEVTYRADTKLYIDKKIAEVINALS